MSSNVAHPDASLAEPSGTGRVTAPFAGVVTLAVAPGDTVAAGAVVATIEAMKLEARLTAPCDGTVSAVAVGPHQQVEGGDVLVVLG